MADFTNLMKTQPTVDADSEMVVKLSHIELEQKRLKVMQQATTAMMAAAALSTGMLIALAVILAIGLQQIRASMDSIAEAIGPAAVASMVEKVQGSLDNALGSTGNVLELTESVEQMGTSLMVATNQSIALLAKANAMTASLMEHPTVQLSLGGGSLGR